MRTLVWRQTRNILAEQMDRSGISAQIAGDQVEERRLARAVGTDEQAALALHHLERDVVGRRQAPERLLQTFELQRSRHDRRQRVHQRRTPGTTPSGMKMTIKTNTRPSSMFQRSRYAET